MNNMERRTMLNLDIIVVLLSHIPGRRDISSVMRTCKAAYAAGIPAILRQNVRLSKQKTLASFLDFILVDAPVRAKHIKGLTFTSTLSDVKDNELSKKLVEVLDDATEIEELIVDSCDAFLAVQPKVAEALARLQGVKSLHIREGGLEIVKLVKEIQSPVEDAHVHLNGQLEEDPVLLLEKFQLTLKRLFCWLPYFSDDDNGIVFRELRQLDVVFWNNVEMGPMIRAFPNVRRVSLSLQGYDDGGLEEDEEEIREKNETIQETEQWQHLELVQGDPKTLYISALKAELGTLDLRVHWEANPEQISSILSNARPQRLNFRFEADWDNESDVIERLPAVLNAAAEDITHFYAEVKQIEDPSTAIDLLCKSISEMLKLVHLTFETERTTLDDVEPLSIAQRFLDAGPTLRSQIITLSRCSTTFWKVFSPTEGQDDAERNDESPSLMELSKAEALKLGILELQERVDD